MSNYRVDDDDDTKILVESATNMGKLGLTSESSQDEQRQALLWALLASYLPDDVRSIQKDYVHHVEYTLAQTRNNLTPVWSFQAAALTVRDRLIERWKDTQIYFQQKDCKRVAYLSMEYLMGRSLQNAVTNLGLRDNFTQAISQLGQNLENIAEQERDAGLGNGGLGRLAACFLDSMATLDLPGWGYGLRYTYGMFRQKIVDGEQKEFPDYWMFHGTPWDVERMDVVQPVKFHGHVEETVDEDTGKIKFTWAGGDEVLAVAYDVPIPGYRTFNTLNIRLWSATPSREFDLENFNKGDFYKSVEERQRAETITHVLYPNDNTEKGKELRLKQQYFFVCATVGDLIRRFLKQHSDFTEFPDHVAIQLNDTHPTLAVVELLRRLLDIYGYEWEAAWDIIQRTFAYTNHTVLPEALETWPVSLMESLLPRHMQLIYDINLRFLKQVESRWPGDLQKLQVMSIIQEHPYRAVRMANLAIVASHTVNGVAALHSKLLVDVVFKDFHEYYPDKFQNKTNGVTPRRWMQQANPDLSMLISGTLRTEDWLLQLDLLQHLRQHADDAGFQDRFWQVKRSNKMRLAQYVKRRLGITISPDALFDVQVKRIHEYKRQLMNIIFVVHRYVELKAMSPEERAKQVPRVVFFSGKAAPGYHMAKKIIKLINNVGEVINHDPSVSTYLKVVFIPNYSVSAAEVIIPASDISQHISTAGMEASGTSNMKFSMNGGIIIGTLDGANIEIREEVGDENMFIFGAETPAVPGIREQIRKGDFSPPAVWTNALAKISEGVFGPAEQFKGIVDSVSHGNDYYLVSYDFESYLEAQRLVEKTFQDKKKWVRMAIMNTAGSGKFSSDRTIMQYAKEIWNVHPHRRPGPTAVGAATLDSKGLIGADRLSSSLLTSAVNLERLSPAPGRFMDNSAPRAKPAEQVTLGFNIGNK
mmetsp:Transcript_11767/g.47517  ORF Transcript_11767/g.47517 Transcript_11767/m.47517 type:complete len:927 (-) Transcript_11767:43-2823(-)